MKDVSMTSRRKFLKSISTAGAAGALLAFSGPTASAEVPAMSKETQSAMSPEEALKALKDGNKRFVSGNMLERNLMDQVRSTAAGQFPFGLVLGCIDSRVPPELVFDQGIGDLFSSRIAGNYADTGIIGGIEFATRLAGAKLVVVLGHSECGAVKGACDFARLGNLTHTLSNITPAVYAVNDVKGDRTSGNKVFVQKVADENVRLNVKVLTERSVVLRELVDEGKLKIVGAMHDVHTGVVKFFD